MENNQKTLPLVSELPQVSTPQLSKSPDKSKGIIGNLSFKFGTAAMLVLLATACGENLFSKMGDNDPTLMYDVNINYSPQCACFEVDGTSLLPENQDTLMKWMIYGTDRDLEDYGSTYIGENGDIYFQTTSEEITPTKSRQCLEWQFYTPNNDQKGSAGATALNPNGTVTGGYESLEDCEEETQSK